MALTKEDLDNIKLPLSEEDYRMLRLEDARTSYNVWKLASPELRAAFDKKEAERVYENKRTRKGCLYNMFLKHFEKMTTGLVIDDYWEDTDEDSNT